MVSRWTGSDDHIVLCLCGCWKLVKGGLCNYTIHRSHLELQTSLAISEGEVKVGEEQAIVAVATASGKVFYQQLCII